MQVQEEDKEEEVTSMKRILIVSGATATGKSALGIRLAKELDGEIVNADSVQVYRGLDIGSAKLSLEEQEGVPHHLIDIVDPDQEFTVADFKRKADQLIEDIVSRGKLPIVVGGSTLYIKVLLHGLAPLPAGDKSLRDELKAMSLDALQAELEVKDPKSYALIDQKNKRKLIRALESIRQGVSPSELQAEHSFSGLDYSALIILLELEREELYGKINRRAATMLKSGLVEETQSLIRDYGSQIAPLQALGYRQVVEQRTDSNNHPEQNLVEEISKHTRRYAKRQLTFWRNEPGKSSWKCFKTENLLEIKHLENVLKKIDQEVHLYRAARISICES